jgi:glycerol-3-phosphate dehydrogenase (NAD(P)+)
MSKKYKVALVVGAGAFGTSIASVLANNFDKVILKVRSNDVYEGIKDDHENKVYLPGLRLADNVIPAINWDQVDVICNVDNLDLIVSGLPAAGIESFFLDHHDRFSNYFDHDIPLLSLSKGIDPVTLELSDDLFYDNFPKHRELFNFLSGPSFAKEIMQEQITLVTIAGRSKKVLTKVIDMTETRYFRSLASYDVKGVLLGGALKNVIAIAGGIIEGLGYNYNTRAAMITRAIADMLKFGKVFNARTETFYGLSGMGDLILTTTGELSRNKSFGLEIAKGRAPEEIISSQRTVVEGYKTTKAAYLLSKKYDLKANIFNGVYDVLYGGKPAQEAIEQIMKIPIMFEDDSHL